MDIGLIGLGNMGFPIARRLVEAGHTVVAFDTRAEVISELVAFGARAASSARDVADNAETVMASLPSPQASRDVATAVAEGSRIRRFMDFSTVGRQAAIEVHDLLAARSSTGRISSWWVPGCIRRARTGPTSAQPATPAMVRADGPCADVDVVCGAQLGFWAVSGAACLKC